MVQVCHGDIKSENVMVTSWNWLLLTDFASFKPTYLPEVSGVLGTRCILCVTRLFYTTVFQFFIWGYLGEPVPEETFTHLHLS